MKKALLKAAAGVMLGTFIVFGYHAIADAARITKTLDEDKKMMPPGVIVTTSTDIPKFKKGTAVTLNEYGEVLEGILADDVSLPYETGISQDSVKPSAMTYTPLPFYIFSYSYAAPTGRVLPFKAGTKVIFNDKGEVIKGTISSSNQSIVLNPANHIQVSDAEISFYKNGMVATCTLASDSYLRPVGWSQILTENYPDGTVGSGFIEFKAGKPILLNEKGEIIRGTLNKDTKLLSPVGILSSVGTAVKVYEAGTMVEFDDKGIVVKSSK
ncbi:MAG: hypothetical protein P4N59_13710 [Negativicutes bacterium]|nr:hypothetical protein [Negativicutes bacterium]